MMDNITFRSSVGGFNRADVIQYIKEILEQNETLSDRVSTLEKKLAACEAQNAEKDSSIMRLEAENRAMRDAQNDVRQLGAAMFDARRFSDQLIREANGKISSMMETAKGTSSRLNETVESLLTLLASSEDAILNSLTEVNGELTNLKAQIEGFGNEVAGEQDSFRQYYVPLSEEAEASAAPAPAEPAPQRYEQPAPPRYEPPVQQRYEAPAPAPQRYEPPAPQPEPAPAEPERAPEENETEPPHGGSNAARRPQVVLAKGKRKK